MGSSNTSSAERDPSPEFLQAFRERADARGEMDFATFMDLSLYHSKVGYYRRPGTRVGYARSTDFFTASSSGAIFGELICAAAKKLARGRSLAEFTFVEVGAEPGGSVMAGVEHPFSSVRTIRVGDPLEIAGECVVFSNELFDAQPVRRFVFRDGGWQERGVALHGEKLSEVDLQPAAAPPMALPTKVMEGYTMDLPLSAQALAEKIAMAAWRGLFLAFDYGKSWRELIEATPQGTVRAYYRHTQSNDLLARPGHQDLTAHVCWDWIRDALVRNGFSEVDLHSQEAFFVHHAGEFIAAATAAEARHFSRRKQSLLQLLHPTHLGQKFQVMHAWR